MTDLPIRVSAKAVIIDGDQILLTRNLAPEDPGGEFFLLPGGGQNYGEPLVECVKREVWEETGYTVDVGNVLWVRDYIGANHEFAAYEPDVHQVEIMFACSVDRSRSPAPPTEVDAWQLAVEWIRLDMLPNLRFFPAAMVSDLVRAAGEASVGGGYLGDVN